MVVKGYIVFFLWCLAKINCFKGVFKLIEFEVFFIIGLDYLWLW